MSNDYDFEPNWEAYHKMDDEERQARKELLKLLDSYSKGKVSYEKYISTMDNSYFFSILSSKTMKEIKDFNNQKNKEEVQKNISFIIPNRL